MERFLNTMSDEELETLLERLRSQDEPSERALRLISKIERLLEDQPLFLG